MGMFLGIIGMLGVPVCLIWLIVSLFRSSPKKPPLLAILVCVVLVFAGAALDMSGDKAPSDSPEELEAGIPGQGEPDDEEASQEPLEDSEDSDSGPLQSGAYELSGGVKLRFYDSVQEDVTGRWRLSKISSNLAPSDYALEYYETMFSSDDEIHAIWNTMLNTTARIMVSNGILFVDTMKYVDGEEKSAKLLFSGEILDSQIIDLATGNLIEETEDQKPEQTPAPIQDPVPEQTTPSASAQTPEDSTPKTEPVATPAPSQPVNSSGTNSGNGSNFNTYDNAEQQQTEDKWVLNTSTKKIHYPTCREVKKIAPQNYSTSNLDESKLIDQGYTTCGVCH